MAPLCHINHKKYTTNPIEKHIDPTIVDPLSFHLTIAVDLIICPEAKYFMKGICDICPGVGWYIAFSIDFVKIHIFQCLNGIRR